MITRLMESMDLPSWMTPRYRRLEFLDRILDGTIYDKIPYAFENEADPSGKYIPMSNRRPSARYNFIRKTSSEVARKLFVGRHLPQIRHDNPKVAEVLNRLLNVSDLGRKLEGLAIWGSVGSICVVFHIVGTDGDARPVIDVKRAKNCYPIFDAVGQLKFLRVAYVSYGSELIPNGYDKDYTGDEIEMKMKYWFIQDYTTEGMTTYVPILESQWNPITEKDTSMLIVDPNRSYTHKLNYVTAHWFENLAGGEPPDGACTWEAAIPLAIEMDYVLSSVGAGVRYNAAPQLVTKGKFRGEDDDESTTIHRGPSRVLALEGDQKDPDGTSWGGAEAYLLEVTGKGVESGLEYFEVLRKAALDVISAQRKDPEKLHGALAASAMALLDEAFLDLVQELRTSYGDFGILPLIEKIAFALIRCGSSLVTGLNETDFDGAYLEWPRLYQSTPDEAAQIVNALVGATTSGLLDPNEGRAYLQRFFDIVPIKTEMETKMSQATGSTVPQSIRITPESNSNSMNMTVPGSTM